MSFLPIVSRELRLASRRRATYWLRSVAALAILIAGTWLFIMLQGSPTRELAGVLFGVLTGGAVLFALLSGPRSTADCISEEKREGTLGLLFLTDLKGYDVVSGKLVAGSLNSFYTVVAMVPMLAIPLLLGGGITLAEFGRMALVTLDALFFSLTLGIWASSMCRSAQKSSAVCSLLLILFVVISPAVGALVAILRKSQSMEQFYLAPSIGFSYYLAFDGPYRLSKEWFWISLGVVHAVSWMALVLASFITPSSWQDKRLGSSGHGWRERWRDWSYGNPSLRLTFRRHALEFNPIFWLNARDLRKSVGPWLFLLFLGTIWMWCWWKFRHDFLNEGVYVMTAWIVNLVLRYWFAGEATRCMAEQRKVGALELLLSTPLPVEEILRGQWLALRRQFLGPVIVVLMVEIIFMLATVKESVPQDDRLFWISLWSGAMLMLIADFGALFVIGLWQGLTARTPLRALGATLVRVLAFPWALFGAVLLAMALVQMGSHGFRSSPSWTFFLGLWFALGIGSDVLFGMLAWQKLRNEFRLAAQEQYLPPGDLWSRIFPRSSGPGKSLEPATLGVKTG